MEGKYKLKEQKNGIKIPAKKNLGMFFLMNNNGYPMYMVFKFHWICLKEWC